jgi:hypothetical protein
MRVSELIEKLKEMPQDAEVKFKEAQSNLVYGASFYADLRISSITEDEKKNVVYLWEN